MELALMIEGQEGVTWPQWLELARACEAHGIPALFRSDHHMDLDGRTDRGALDAWTTLAALGATTSRLRLGTLVSPVGFRHPSALAKAVVTADHVSGGRVELGVGAGWHRREHEAHGFGFPPLAERFERLGEQLEILHGHWGEGTFSFAGRQYRLDGLDAQPKPLQRPHPPVIVGGGAGPRSAALAARWADEYNTAGAAPAEIARRRERIARACAAAGREPLPLSVTANCLVGSDHADLRARARRLAEHRGEDAEPAHVLAHLPPDWIVGTVADAAAQLAALRAAGVRRVMLGHPLAADLDAVELIGRRLAPLLGPASGRA